MDEAKARQKIRENLDSGDLLRDFDLPGDNVFIATSYSEDLCGVR